MAAHPPRWPGGAAPCVLSLRPPPLHLSPLTLTLTLTLNQTLTLTPTPTQVPGGALADKLGAKNVMTATLLLSGLCCIAVPLLAGPFGLMGVWCAIAFMGAFQGPMFPTSSVFLSKWMPGKDAPGGDEKAWGTSMLDIGISLGSLLIIPTANSIADAVGWRGTYTTIGLATVAFACAWHVLAADAPSKCWYISAAELALAPTPTPTPAPNPDSDPDPTPNRNSTPT